LWNEASGRTGVLTLNLLQSANIFAPPARSIEFVAHYIVTIMSRLTKSRSARISIAEFVGDVPSDTENDDRAIKVAAMKRGPCVREELIHAADYQPNPAFAPEPKELTSDVKPTSKRKV
jgi:hypothetical protein